MTFTDEDEAKTDPAAFAWHVLVFEWPDHSGSAVVVAHAFKKHERELMDKVLTACQPLMGWRWVEVAP